MPQRYLDITTDFGFKRMFGREESKDILKGFLFAMLNLPYPIADLDFIPNEQLPESPAERIGIYDVYCKDTHGNRFIVEMQRNAVKYFKERTLYYATFPIIQQIEKGTFYNFRLMPVYCVSILRYPMDDEPDYLQHVQLVNTKTGKVFYDKLTFVYVELPKFTLQVDDLKTNQEKWVYLLKHMDAMDDVPQNFHDDPFPQAFHIAELAALSEHDRYIYRRNIKQITDEQLVLEAKIDEGRREGRIEGMREGERKGRREGILEGERKREQKGKHEGERKGLLAGIQAGLHAKFGDEATPLLDTLHEVKRNEHLQAILTGLWTVQSLHEVEQLINQYRNEQETT